MRVSFISPAQKMSEAGLILRIHPFTYKNHFYKPEVEETRITFVLDTAQNHDHGNTLFLG